MADAERSRWLAELYRAFPGGGQPPAPDCWAGVAREAGAPGRYRIVTAGRKSRAAALLSGLIDEGMRPVALVDLTTGEAWRIGVSLSQGPPLSWPGRRWLD